MHLLATGSVGLLYAGSDEPRHDRDLVAGETVFGQELTYFQFHQLQQLGIIHQVDLVEEDDQGGYVHLASQQNVLTGLRHRAVGGGNHQDGAVHLGSPGDHVLDEVGVAGAVDVGIMPFVGFVLHVGHGDGYRLGRIAHRPALGDIGIRLEFGHPLLFLHGQDRTCQGGLAVVNVSDRSDIDVRFSSLKYVLGHAFFFLPALGQTAVSFNRASRFLSKLSTVKSC